MCKDILIYRESGMHPNKKQGDQWWSPCFFRRGYRASKESQMVSVISVTEPPETVTFSAEQCPP